MSSREPTPCATVPSEILPFGKAGATSFAKNVQPRDTRRTIPGHPKPRCWLPSLLSIADC